MARISATDTKYLTLTLELAEKGRGRTFPNPMVGAVVVNRGRIVGQGYHRKAGSAHAEVEALAAAGARARGATLYVNLEPCNHWGRTPPCVDAIIAGKIKRVVCCTRDPHKAARGGVEKLKRAGIAVSVGGLEQEARDLNEAFFTFHEMLRPFVAIKFAASLDGKIATRTGDSKWITNRRARAYARALRGCYQAILVGINTVLKDNPHLGTRKKGKKDPLRIVLDSRLRIPLTARVLRDGNILLITTKRANAKKRRVLVEGGGSVLGSFVGAGLVDKAYIFQAPLIIGGEAKSAIGGRGANKVREALQLTRIEHNTFGDNTLVIGYPKRGRRGGEIGKHASFRS